MDRPLKLYVSYSSEDEAHRSDLEKHLSPLLRQGVIEIWYPHRISPGDPRQQLIDRNLEEADAILLLISPDFVHSDHCFEVEAKRAMDQHAQGSSRVIPIFLRPVDSEATPFVHIKMLPENGKPITKWSNRDEAWRDVAQSIRRIVEEIDKEKKNLVAKHNRLTSEYRLCIKKLEEVENKYKEREKAENRLSSRLAQAQEQIADISRKLVAAENARMRLEGDNQIANTKLELEQEKKAKLQENLSKAREEISNNKEIIRAREELTNILTLTRLRIETLDDLPYEEIANWLKLSVNTVRSYRSQPHRWGELADRISDDVSIMIKALMSVSRKRSGK